MKDIRDILRQREADCARVRNEIEALRFVIPLLEDERPKGEEREDAVSASSSKMSQSQILSRRNVTRA